MQNFTYIKHYLNIYQFVCSRHHQPTSSLIVTDVRYVDTKGRPGSGTTKLGSGAQKRLRRSRIEGYGPRPQARMRLAHAKVGQLAAVRADRRPLRSPALVARADFLKAAILQLLCDNDHSPPSIASNTSFRSTINRGGFQDINQRNDGVYYSNRNVRITVHANGVLMKILFNMALNAHL